MLTRLKVNGFKNLVDVDVRFGPFTCIAGVNGSGKSNLFDAIRFLAALAEKPLVEAALSIVRGSGGRSADIRSLFCRVGGDHAPEMSFEAEMIVPAEGTDDLGQAARAGTTYLRYALTLGLTPSDRPGAVSERLTILKEELRAMDAATIADSLRFPNDKSWVASAVRSERLPNHPYISTTDETAPQRIIRLHLDGGPASQFGSKADLVAQSMSRTAVSSTDASDGAAATLAQQEMRSWRVVHLDPAAMRTPDDVTAPTTVGSNGAHVPSTLYSIAHRPPTDGDDAYAAETAVYARVAGRIWRLVGEVWELAVERDDKREELTVYVTDRNGTRHSARTLSDGMLRMLALAVIEEEQRPGLLCIEEPENGIHPGRIASLLSLLQAIAMDTNYPTEEGNPLRQVIISTHSPSVVMRVPADSLVVAELRDTVRDGKHFNRALFSGLANTWRDPVPSRKSLALGTLLTYLNPEGYRPLPRLDPDRDPDAGPRIMDRPDVRDLLTPLPNLDG